MANEGIMAAPLPMQKKEPSQGYVSSLDAYNAASSALQETDPQAFSEYKSAISQTLGGLNLKPSEIEAFVTLLEYMLQYPEQYGEIIRQGIEAGAIEEGDFPAQFDPNFISTMLAAMNEQRIQRAQNVAPETMAPGPQEPMAMKSGGLADAAQALQGMGRHGDTMLAHITPQEAEMLRQAGGMGTLNPYTGLREYGWLQSAWKAVTEPVKAVVNVVKEVASSPIGRIALTIGATMVLGPAVAGFGIGTAGTAALVSGGLTALSGGNLTDTLKSAALGYIGGTIAPSVGEYLPGATGSILNQGLTAGALGTGFGLASGMSLKNALRTGAVSGLTGAGVAYSQQQGYIPGRSNVSQDGLGVAPSVDTDSAYARDIDAMALPNRVEATGPLPAVGTAADQPGANVSAKGIPPPANVTPTNLSPPANVTPTNLSPPANVAPQDFQTEYLRSIGMGPDSVSTASPGPSPSNIGIERDVLGMTGPVDTARQAASSVMDPLKAGYKEYLSPDRPAVQAENQKAILEGSRARAEYVRAARAEGLTPTTAEANAAYEAAYSANKPGLFSKYTPLAAAGLGATAVAGGFKRDPGTQTPAFNRNYTGQDYMRENPSQFSGSLYNYQSQGAGSYNPYRETSYSGAQGANASGVVTPTGTLQAEYSPYYGRRAQRRQQYYSPFLGTEEPVMAAKGGSIREFPRKNGPINGPGTGTSDDIPAMLSDGEFVFTAKAVRNAGAGSRRKGAARMYKLMKSLEKGGMVKG
jgi:hypothetical protein